MRRTVRPLASPETGLLHVVAGVTVGDVVAWRGPIMWAAAPRVAYLPPDADFIERLSHGVCKACIWSSCSNLLLSPPQ